MPKHIHIHFAPRKQVRDQSPGSVPPSNLMPLVEALHAAIAARQAEEQPTQDEVLVRTTTPKGYKVADADFDESKVKRDEGGRFSAQQHTAAAEQHKAEAAKHDASYKATGAESSAAARNAHQEAADLHEIAAGHVNAQTGWAAHNAQKAHNATTAAKQASAAAAGPASLDQLKAQASDPQASIEQRAAAVAQLSKMEKMANEVAASPHAIPQIEHGSYPQYNPDTGEVTEGKGAASMSAQTGKPVKGVQVGTTPMSATAKLNWQKKMGYVPSPELVAEAAKETAERRSAIGLPPEPGHGPAGRRQAAAALAASVTQPPAGGAAPQAQPASGKPTSAKASGAKAATHELLSSGHPFSVDELMKATGCSNRTTLMTALSDLKSPKYAGKLGHLAIEKNPDGTYQVKGLGPIASPAELSQAKSRNRYAEARKTDPRPTFTSLNGKTATEIKNNLQASGGVSAKPGPAGGSALPMRSTPKGGDVNPAQNVQARIDAKKQGLPWMPKINPFTKKPLSEEAQTKFTQEAAHYQKEGGVDIPSDGPGFSMNSLHGHIGHEASIVPRGGRAASSLGGHVAKNQSGDTKHFQAHEEEAAKAFAAAPRRVGPEGGTPQAHIDAKQQPRDPHAQMKKAWEALGASYTRNPDGSTSVKKGSYSQTYGPGLIPDAPDPKYLDQFGDAKKQSAAGAENDEQARQEAHARAESKYSAESKKMQPDVRARQQELLARVPTKELVANPYYHHAQAERQARLDVFRKSLPGGKLPIPRGPDIPEAAGGRTYGPGKPHPLAGTLGPGAVKQLQSMAAKRRPPAGAQAALGNHAKELAAKSVASYGGTPTASQAVRSGQATGAAATRSGAGPSAPGLHEIAKSLSPVLRQAAESYPGSTPITAGHADAAARYMAGKTGVDILKMSEALGISVGAAKHLNEARKAHYSANAASKPSTSASRSEAYLKQKHIGLIKK